MIADIFRILGLIFMGISGLFLVWNGLGMIMAFFVKKKTFPSLKEYPQSAILICARNEEKVIGNLISSLNQMDYPKDKYRVFVVAHNCSDHTARIASELGAEVIVHNNAEQRTKGDALHVGLEHIRKKYRGKYKTITIFDADNVSDSQYLKQVNAAIAAGNDVALGLRRSKNRYATPISQLAGSLFLAVNWGHDLPHTWMKLPMPVSGTGFTFRSDILGPEGWQTETITEDMEFSLQQQLQHRQFVLVADAVYYDEQPLTLHEAMKQQLRWGVGRTQCLRKFFIPVLKMIPRYPGYALSVMMDLMVNFFLTCSVLGAGCQILAALLSLNLISILLLLGGAVIGYVGAIPISIMLMMKEKLTFRKDKVMFFFMPLFYLIPAFFACVSVFKRKTKWRAIRHEDQTHVAELKNENKE